MHIDPAEIVRRDEVMLLAMRPGCEKYSAGPAQEPEAFIHLFL